MTEEKSLVKGFGSRLKAEREAREVTLEGISRVTKISIHLLHAMEEDEWEALPGGIFTRNFIRLYAKHLGLDSERWVDEYHHFAKLKRKADGEDEVEEKATTIVAELPRGWLVALVIVSIALLVGGYFVISYFRDASEKNRQQQEVTKPAESTRLPVQNQTSDEPVIIKDNQQYEGLTVELLESANRCWFQWWADGELKSPSEGENLEQGVTFTLKAQSAIKLHLAHLNSVGVIINGRKYEWSELNPTPRTNEDGQPISFMVEIAADSIQ